MFAGLTYALFADQEIETLTLTGTGDFDATGNSFNNTVNGNAGDNELFGKAGNDSLNSGDGADELDGGTGNDTMVGGKGDDTYFVDSTTDKIMEAVGQGRDKIFVDVASLTMAANVEDASLLAAGGNVIGNTLGNAITGNGVANKLDGGSGDDNLKGNTENDTLIGGIGNDILDGGAGDDTQIGGAGNDIYDVDDLTDLDDVITELAGGGTDLVRASVGGMILAANVENLTLVRSDGHLGHRQRAVECADGQWRQNTLSGGKGNDKLDGGTGADTLNGGLGNDVYFLDNVGDKVEEGAGGGTDIVHSLVGFSFGDSVQIETVIFDAAMPILCIANNFANTLTMVGTGKATMNGNGGNDTLTGSGADDALLGGNDNDVLNGGSGNDGLAGGNGNDKLTGGEGDDTLIGGAGKDTMVGGKGDDTYIVEDIGDTVTELAGQGVDTVDSRLVSYTLGATVENLDLGTGAVNGTGNALANDITGNVSDNKLDGGGGDDAINAGDGKDTRARGPRQRLPGGQCRRRHDQRRRRHRLHPGRGRRR